MQANAFPFKLEDLKSWTVRRTDGTVTKFTINTVSITRKDDRKDDTSSYVTSYANTSKKATSNLSSYCSHVPKESLFEVGADEREYGHLALYVGSVFGARQTKSDFDYVIDCGDCLNLYDAGGKLLEGDEELKRVLYPYTVGVPSMRLLKIDWADRKAPDVVPEFWTKLNEQLAGDVMTTCQGGHGRSGTSFVCLLLNNAPDYDALDAIVHLRAVHCPRAIESVVQHEYINDVAKFLGRTPNALDVGSIQDYKEAFKASNRPTAIKTRKLLGWA